MAGEASEEVVQVLQRIERMIVLSMIDGKKQEEQIRFLSAAGYVPKDIAALIGTTPNNVSVRLSAMRRATKRKP